MTAIIQTTPFLRMAVLGDAAASGATGLLLAAGAGPLAGLFGLPEPLLRSAGLILLPYAALVAWAGARPALPRNVVRAIIVINLLWVLDSAAALLAFGPVGPRALGVAFVLAQASVVLGFAAAQWTALRRAMGAASTKLTLA